MIDADKLSAAILSARVQSPGPIRQAMCDTAAVAAAGAFEPVTRAVKSAYAGDAALSWAGDRCESIEAAVLADAVAAHALDFDDVYLDSHVHASAVLTPVVLRLGKDEEDVEHGFAAGLVAAQVMAAALGPDHYRRGWHGTGTIGAFAAAAAAARILKLSGEETRSALALVAAMSGGLQANFGTMAKPCQAGFAACAGVRAARLACAGVVGSPDALGPAGFVGLYGDPVGPVPADAYVPRPERMSTKLFPSCFAAARLIGVALDSRAAVQELAPDPDVALRLVVPTGSLAVLRYDRPTTGAQAKFSAHYNVARALCSGAPVIDHFDDAAIADPAVQGWMDRITVTEDPAQQSQGDIRAGAIRLEVRRHGEVAAIFERHAIPGSPDDPATAWQLATKWRTCLSRYREEAGSPYPLRRVLAAAPSALTQLAAFDASY